MGPSRAIRLASACAAAAACLFGAAARDADAQTSRFALDTVVAVDGDAGSQVVRKATAWFDLFGAVRITDGLDLRVRPVVFRRSFDGGWRGQIYELALRYERPGDVGYRIEAGQIPSPIGLSILENRPNLNPVVSQHSTLYLPLPRFEAGTPTNFLLAASYPLGAQVTVTGKTWDARAAVTDGSPVRGRPFFGDNKPPRMANLIFGAGVTPHIGVRIGASVAHGGYAGSGEVRDPARGDRNASVAQVEGEWSFGHTRMAGEYLWTGREMAVGEARAHGGWAEITQAIRPRWFVVARYDDQRTRSTSLVDNTPRLEIYRRFETAVGYRLTPELTLRGSYLTRKGYVVGFWDDQVLGSIVFARKIQ
ncbi:MAG: hypothetical protein Q7R30_02505 [Acidobacteriota bacterium]|nr:hypothetical protein [Acidobacteriota bacterium]